MSDRVVRWKMEIDTAEAEAKLERLILLAERESMPASVRANLVQHPA